MTKVTSSLHRKKMLSLSITLSLPPWLQKCNASFFGFLWKDKAMALYYNHPYSFSNFLDLLFLMGLKKKKKKEISVYIWAKVYISFTNKTHPIFIVNVIEWNDTFLYMHVYWFVVNLYILWRSVGVNRLMEWIYPALIFSHSSAPSNFEAFQLHVRLLSHLHNRIREQIPFIKQRIETKKLGKHKWSPKTYSKSSIRFIQRQPFNRS